MKPRNELANDYHNRLPEGPFQKSFVHGAFVNGYDAGYQAAKNSPEKPDTCEHILDMEKMVDVNSSSGWISVKDQLPEDNLEVLFFSQEYDGCFVGYKAAEGSYVDPESNGLSVSNIQKYYTHWRLLPELPKEDK